MWGDVGFAQIFLVYLRFLRVDALIGSNQKFFLEAKDFSNKEKLK